MDFRGLLICNTRGSPEYYTVEKNSVAICLGSIHNLAGLVQFCSIFTLISNNVLSVVTGILGL